MKFLKNLFGHHDEQKTAKFSELEKSFSGDEEMIKQSKAIWLTSRGNHFGTNNAYQKAVSDFQEAIDLKSDYLPAYFGLAVAYKEMGDVQKGIDVIENAPTEMKFGGKILAKKEDMIKDMEGE